jgi:hypothetical protein
MCGGCWFSLPKAIRDKVWRTWAGGRGKGTPEHDDAMLEAVAALPPLGGRKPAEYH